MLGTINKKQQTSYLLAKGRRSRAGSDVVRNATAGKEVPVTNGFEGAEGQERANQIVANAIGLSPRNGMKKEPATNEDHVGSRRSEEMNGLYGAEKRAIIRYNFWTFRDSILLLRECSVSSVGDTASTSMIELTLVPGKSSIICLGWGSNRFPPLCVIPRCSSTVLKR